jgi:hypothetical protein
MDSSGRTAAIVAVVIVVIVILVSLAGRQGQQRSLWRLGARQLECVSDAACPVGQACSMGKCVPENCLALWPFARPSVSEFDRAVAEAWAHRDPAGFPTGQANCWKSDWAPVAAVEAWVMEAIGKDGLPCYLPTRGYRPTGCTLNKFAALRGWLPPGEVCRYPGDSWSTPEGIETCGPNCRVEMPPSS